MSNKLTDLICHPERSSLGELTDGSTDTMLKLRSISILVLGLLLASFATARAQTITPVSRVSVAASVTPTVVPVASESALATQSALAVEEKPRPQDLTQPKEAKSRLERILDANQPGKLGFTNFIQVAIRSAVSQGVPANTIVLMILFPLIAALVAFARHVIGLQGFGIFTPAVVAVAFLATGVTVGVLLFISILVMATLARIILRRLKLPSMPRMALLLWFVSLGILGLMLLSPRIGLESLVTINIFPILLLVLLAETFIEVQITRTFRSAVELTAETLLLALLSFFVLSIESLQEWVLIRPEITIVLIAVLDILIGRYSGLRLLERWRFREILKS